MHKPKPCARRVKQSDSFTLVELLVVMTIIAILASLVLTAGLTMYSKGMRSRAQGEIQAMTAASEQYKNDNAIYPQGDGALLTNSYASDDGTTPPATGNYQTNSILLYSALSGQTNIANAPATGVKIYMAFKANQVGTVSGFSYAQDPWRKSYGFSTGTTTSAPYSGSGFFDLWSTGGVTSGQVASNPSLTNTWIRNWTQ